MRLFGLELKRILKTRSTWILLILALLLSAVMAYIPTTFVYSTYWNESGKKEEIKGIPAIRHRNEVQKGITGIVTPAMMREAVEVYQGCLNEYGVANEYELPDGVYTERIWPYEGLLHCVREAYADPETGIAPSVMEIDPQKAEDFYDVCLQHLTDLIQLEQKDNPAALFTAEKLYSEVEMPFTMYPSSDKNLMDYQVILIFLIALFCVVIAVPVYSSDYQTGADDILRCTRFGRSRLGITKIVSALVICGAAFAICISVFMVIANSLFGWESTKTSIQMMYSVVSLQNFTMGQLQWYGFATGLVSLLAAISFVLFVSSKCRNTATAMSISILICILPIIIYLMVPGDISSWIRSVIPTSGIAVQSGYIFSAVDFEFLNMGNLSVWYPHALLIVAAIEIPLFIALALISYMRHKVK